MEIINKSATKSAAAILDYILAIIGCFTPTCITLFAGVGGSSVGAHLAGFKELLATDFDPVAGDNFGNYFKDERYVPYWVADIWDISPLDILQRTRFNENIPSYFFLDNVSSRMDITSHVVDSLLLLFTKLII